MTENKTPYIIDCDPGKVAICTCGQSSKMPICDGSHKGSEDRPVIVEVDKPRKLAICSCQQSNNLPYCDGSHSKC